MKRVSLKIPFIITSSLVYIEVKMLNINWLYDYNVYKPIKDKSMVEYISW